MKKFTLLCMALLSTNLGSAQNIDFDKKLKELNIQLFEPAKPMANYVKAVRTGNLLFIAGHGPTKADGSNITGKVGKDLTVEQGYDAARQTGIAILSTSQGVMTDKEARIKGVGGEVLCEVW